MSTPNVGLLASITRGRIAVPLRILLYGWEGIGKSSFASDAPKPIFIGAEDGTAQLDVARFQPQRWTDIIRFLGELAALEHDYETIVIDTVDWAEPLCWEHVCRQGAKPHIEEFGYGKGYNLALEEWRRLLGALDDLRSRRKMRVVLLAHSKIAKFANPEGDDFDRFTLKLHDRAAALLKEWCDIVLFANYETATHTSKRGKTRGIESGARVLHTQRNAAFDAKNRFNLPATLPLSWAEIDIGIAASDPAAARAAIAATLPLLSEPLRADVEAALERAGDDTTKLSKLANWAKAKIQIQAASEAT